jgi:ABC-type sugar transport system substrate-binding protein
MPVDGMAESMNEIADSGVPVAQFNMLSKAMNGAYVGEKSVQSGPILGKMIVEKLGGALAKGKVIIGNCFPGFPVPENARKVSRNH